MNIEDIDKAIAAERPSPSPAAPPSSGDPLEGFTKVLQAMSAMKAYENQIIQGYATAQGRMAQEIRAQVEKEFVEKTVDPFQQKMADAVETLVNAWMTQIPTQPPTAPVQVVDAPQALDQPKKGEQVKLTTEQAEAIADKIYEQYPQDVLAAQAGKITKEAAIAKIKMGGATQENAELIYETLLETDYSGLTK